MNTYQEFSEKTRSQKIIIAHLEARQKVKQFSLESGATYSRLVSQFVISVKVSGSYLTQATSPDLNPGEFFFSSSESKLFLRCLDDEDPKTKSIWIGHRFFFSNIDCVLPSNIISGELVHYDSRIREIGDLRLELDYENTGIALETNSSISLHNNDGFFDDTFDTLIWENNKAKFWSWSKSLPYDQARCIYIGLITEKSFNYQQVRFNLKDQLTQLKQPLEVGRFSNDDGEIEESMIDKPKRIIFGRVNKIRTQGIDKTLSGFLLTGLITGDSNRNLMSGTVSGVLNQDIINGLGTDFTTLTVGEKVRIIEPLNEYVYDVAQIISPSQIRVTSLITAQFNGALLRDLAIENNIMNGSGTDFLNELSPGDRISVTVNGVDYTHTVDVVESDDLVKLSDEVEVGFYNVTGRNTPEIPYRKKNRLWHVAGHKLREFVTTITTVIDLTNIEVDDIGDIQSGDTLMINSRPYLVIRISNNKIRLNQGLIGLVTSGMTVTKIPIQNIYFKTQKLIINRDFTVSNSNTDSIIVFNDQAEFNVAPSRFPSVQLDFVAGSRIIDSVSTDIDLTTIFKPRDWIRSRSINLPDWYEILSVNETQITLRTPVINSYLGLGQFKSPDYIDDDSLVTADCLGMDAGEWIRFPSQAVKWILSESGFTEFNDASFDQAKDDCSFTLALYYPKNFGGELPVIRDMISEINQSCFGSLYLDNDFKFKYSILNADKPEDLEVLRDEDLLSFSVTTKNNIINSILLEFSPFVDVEKGSETTRQMILTSDFVDESMEKKQRLNQTAFLFYEDDAKTIAERWLFFRSLTQTVVSVKAKLNLSGKVLNDKMFLDLSRLFKRFGGVDRRKIGIISSISKDGSETDVEFNDLGNIFNRVPAICPDSTPDYLEGTEDVVKWGFIVDNESETPDPNSESGLGTNLIG